MSHVTPSALKLAVKHYFSQLWLQRKYSIAGLLLPSIGSVLIVYVPPLIIAKAIADFGDTLPTISEAAPFLWLFALTWISGEIFWRIAIFFIIRAETKGMNNLYVFALDELLKKDLGFFHNNFVGSLTKKAIAYARNFEQFVDMLLFGVFTNVLPLVFAAIILYRYSPWLAIVLIGLLTISLMVIIPLIRKRRKLVDVREKASNVMAGHVADVIGNMDAVQSFAHEDHEAARHRGYVMDYMQKAKRSWDFQNVRIDTVISPLFALTNVLGLLLAITVGGDAENMAKIFVVFTYYFAATRIMWEFNRIYRNMENVFTEAAQFTDILLQDSEIVDPPNPIVFSATDGTVEFEHVDFTYDGGNETLFHNFNLSIKAGEKVALVGHSGGGKTTITKLLLRTVDINSGELRIDGQNISHARLSDLRKHIAYVPQEPAMFHRSIRENIRYGNLEASDEAVEQAAKQANAHEFISRLPDGYDTLVGERGVKLSGGQRQRIAIARALIKNAPILVLDEATSALDSESEQLIQAALWKLMEGRTAIVIAHRLSTIQKMDRIIVLDNGSIAEQGSHKELVNNGGIYAKLWAHQSGGFLED